MYRELDGHKRTMQKNCISVGETGIQRDTSHILEIDEWFLQVKMQCGFILVQICSPCQFV